MHLECSGVGTDRLGSRCAGVLPRGFNGSSCPPRVRWAGWTVATVLAAFSTAAETLELTDGSVLAGVTVVSEDAVDLTVTHPLLGTVTLLKNDVVRRRDDAVGVTAGQRAAAVVSDSATGSESDRRGPARTGSVARLRFIRHGRRRPGRYATAVDRDAHRYAARS